MANVQAIASPREYKSRPSSRNYSLSLAYILHEPLHGVYRPQRINNSMHILPGFPATTGLPVLFGEPVEYWLQGLGLPDVGASGLVDAPRLFRKLSSPVAGIA